MIEPKGIGLHIHRRENSLFEGNDSSASFNFNNLTIEHDEPEVPIHPAFEYEVVFSSSDNNIADDTQEAATAPTEPKRTRKRKLKLLVCFLFLIVTGVANVVTLKLQAIPMYNYPNFLNIFAHLMYIPICFAYIIPVARYGWFNNAITAEHISLPRKPFAVMGFLDCLATSMQIFASVYLPGPLLVLLPQAVIPCSMVLSRSMLGAQYRWQQYVGAIVVLMGIGVVLEPIITNRRAPDFYCEARDRENDCTLCQLELTQDLCLSHVAEDDADVVSFLATSEPGNSTNNRNSLQLCQWMPYDEAHKHDETLTFVWSLVMLASTIPMTLSTIYKEVALGGGTELDPIYLNGWIAIFQFLFALVVAVPAGWLASPSVSPGGLPENFWNGALCFVGEGSIDSGCHPDSCSFRSALFVSLYLVSNVLYTSFLTFVLKYGSSSKLFLAQTILLPIGNLAFSLPFLPEPAAVHLSDMIGLLVIMSGLILYRFLEGGVEDGEGDEEPSDEMSTRSGFTPWFQEVIRELREPLIQTGDV